MIHVWLKHYVYNRVIIPGKKPGMRENLATFIISAFWHGFYPFYYIMFFLCAFFAELTKEIYRSRVFFRNIPSPINSLMAQ
jgi:lysophospholipid acyltransferase